VCVKKNKRRETSLVEVAKNLATSAFAPGFFVIHDTVGRCEHDVTELTRGEQILNPLFDVFQFDVEAWADHSALVDAANQVYNDFAITVVVNYLKLANVA
jgi:hypothetical protein